MSGKELSPWKVFLGSEPVAVDMSYTCCALGGRAARLLDMMYNAESASEFVEKYESDPIYIDPDDPDNKATYPYASIIHACERIEQEELIALSQLNYLDCDALKYSELSSEIKERSVKKMEHLLEVLQEC